MCCSAPMGLMLSGNVLLVLSSERDRTGAPAKHGQIFTRRFSFHISRVGNRIGVHSNSHTWVPTANSVLLLVKSAKVLLSTSLWSTRGHMSALHGTEGTTACFSLSLQSLSGSHCLP